MFCLPASIYIIFSLVAVSSMGIACKAPHPVDAARHLHMITDFHLFKCARNGFVSKGLQIPQGHVSIGPIQEPWKTDRETVTQKLMPHITLPHVEPNVLEKICANLAFQLFSKKVLKGLFFYKTDLQKKFRTTGPTEHFVRLMVKFIFVMLSQTPVKGLQSK